MGKDIKLRLAKKLRELRKEYGYTQQKLAELANIDYKHVQRLESKTPSAAKIDTLEKLAKAFRINVSQLVNFK
jgi:transcriptional regulator with XRE-family HTH domain